MSSATSPSDAGATVTKPRRCRYLRRVVAAMQNALDPTVDDIADLTDADGVDLVLLVESQGRSIGALSGWQRWRAKEEEESNGFNGWHYLQRHGNVAFFNNGVAIELVASWADRFRARVGEREFTVQFPGPTTRSNFDMTDYTDERVWPVTDSLHINMNGWQIRGHTLTSARMNGAEVTLTSNGDFLYDGRPIVHEEWRDEY